MIVGFGRSAAHEWDNLRLQFLDIPDPAKVDAKAIAENFLRFHVKELESDNLLYTAEPEVVIDSSRHELVPRLRPIPAANDRYNSIQRPITQDVDASKAILELQHDGSGYTLRQLSRYEILNEIKEPKSLTLRVTHAVVSSLKTSIGHKFLILGVDPFRSPMRSSKLVERRIS